MNDTLSEVNITLERGQDVPDHIIERIHQFARSLHGRQYKSFVVRQNVAISESRYGHFYGGSFGGTYLFGWTDVDTLVNFTIYGYCN